MSDEKETIRLSKVIVQRSGSDNLYYVCIFRDGYWSEISKGYPHSTSAYAKLGRIVNKATLDQIEKERYEGTTELKVVNNTKNRTF